MALPVITSAPPVEYPDADGQPMAESDWQRKPLTYAVEALGIYFQQQEDVYVSGNLFIYYEEGNPQAVVAPDVFVVFGATKRDRRTYLLWSESKAPDFVLEITSRSTYREDQETKPAIYARLGVQEYWQYDPTGDYLSPPLQGSQLVAGRYQPLRAPQDAGGRHRLHSVVLGLDLVLEDGGLRFTDPVTGQKLLTHQESAAARQVLEAALHDETTARQALEATLRDEITARQALEARLAEMAAQLQVLHTARATEPAPPSP